MKINDATIDLVKEFEGFRAESYRDAVGVWTIGYGTTAMAGVGIVPRPGLTITKEEAEVYLRMGLEKFAKEITPAIKRPANENQFGAMLSLAYNIGPSAFKRSTLLRKFNAGDTVGAASEFLRWNKAGGAVSRGLERRRRAEVALFNTPVEAAPASFLAKLIEILMGILKGGRK